VAGQSAGRSWLITIFLLLTAPISALFLAKTLLHGHEDPASLPPTGTDQPWATLAEDRIER
jgi:multicomponent K+:H+ antiporter subunit G